ncbi:MAG: hypothetical protein JSW02_11280 [candidate division WOR-3 bacterium]|nr:MAG: hypothetical protein JSW02_11280 [candidate division WOR-3 bacterium]
MIVSISLICFQAMNPVLASAIMPGLGELIQGEKTKAHTFFVVEGSIWLSYFGFNYFGHKIDQSARAYAVEHAGANQLRSDEEYYNAVEDYLSASAHNLEVERNASLLYPDDPVSQQEYIEEFGYFGDDVWEWDTLTSRTYYWNRRKDARENLRRAGFMPGFAVINRIISIIDVLVFSEQDRIRFDSRPGKIGVYFKF